MDRFIIVAWYVYRLCLNSMLHFGCELITRFGWRVGDIVVDSANGS